MSFKYRCEICGTACNDLPKHVKKYHAEQEKKERELEFGK